MTSTLRRRIRRAPAPLLTPSDLQDFLGRPCHIVVDCGVCGGQHARFGTLKAGACAGEVVLGGMIYRVDDISFIRRDDTPVTTIPAYSRALPYLTLVALLLTWLRFAHR